MRFKNNCYFKIVLFENIFFFKIMFFRKNVFFKILLFKSARKTQNLRILRDKMDQNVTFCVQIFFFQNLLFIIFFCKIMLFKNNFFFKIWRVEKKFLFKIWRVMKILIQNLTRCKIFNSKSAFKSVFSDSRWIIIKVLPTWLTMAWGKKISYECVACVCLTFFTIFLVIVFFMTLGLLIGVITISFALPIDLYKSLWISENG